MAVAVLAERKRMLVGTPGSVGVIWVVAARGMPQLLVPHRKEQTALGRTVCLCAEVSARTVSYPEWLGGKYACAGMLFIYFPKSHMFWAIQLISWPVIFIIIIIVCLIT